jgi:uncharacterized protein YfaS (alpha-2-macroglobulin family)
MFLKSACLTTVILLSYLVFFGQTNFPYEKEWKLIDSLISKKNLPKSALIEVNKVYDAAKKEKNEAQWVRAIIYKNHLQLVDDRDINVQMREIENEILEAPVAVASLLKSIGAEYLNQYLMGYGYQIRNRTAIVADTAADITTWSGERLSDKISSLYISSIQDTNLLIKTLSRNYDAVLDTGSNRKLRPTLFDLLAWRALSYFQSAQDGIKSPADDAVKSNSMIFSDAGIFSQMSLIKKEVRTGFIQSLQIYQQLLRLHEKDKSVDAFVDADINRIQFVYQNSKFENKDSLYVNALENIVVKYHFSPASAQAIYLQAEWWATQAQKYKPLTDSSHRYDYLKAIELCNEALNNPSGSEGKSNCQTLLSAIQQRSFSLKTEAANLPDQPFRIQVTYKNIDHLYNRVIRIDKSKRTFLDTRVNYPEYWSTLIRMPVTRKFEQIIPETGDYQEHIVEIPCEGLDAGQYILLTSSDPDFSDSAVIGMTTFFATSIAYMRNGCDYFVIDRDSGSPLSSVRVEYLIGDKKHNTSLTDKNGHFVIKSEQYGANISLKFFYQNDFYYDEQYVYMSRNISEQDEYDDESTRNQKEFEKTHLRDIIFTDRSLYRPGQIIYFKGLLVTQDFKTKRSKIVPQKQTTIFLKDVNNQKLDSLVLTSNDFGSLQGSFHIPQGVLNGEFKLYDIVAQTEHYFSVEEYKRPKYYIQFDTLRNTYAVRDTISIRGSALAYSGNTIDGAKYTWTVSRAVRFPYPWMFENFPSRSSGLIESGSGETDEHGRYNFRFVLTPDKTMTSEKNPVFNYMIEVTVTDGNGETRSETTTVSASYRSCEIVSKLPLQSVFAKDSLSLIPVTTVNASGNFVKEELGLTIFSINGPGRLIRKRYWEEPDQFIFSEKQYISLFPYDEYKNESDFKSWKIGAVVYRKTDSTRENGYFSLDQKAKNLLGPGWYCILFRVKDKNGEEIIDKKYVEISDNRGHAVVPSYNKIPEQDLYAQPGNSPVIETGTDAKDVHVIRSRQEQINRLSYSYYDLNQNASRTALNITEADRGGYSIQDAFVKNNRFYTSIHNIHVPWTNKELNISYETWRDKILPGSRQQWKIRITGNKSDKVFAEVMSVMYDASLDKIKRHSWSVPNLFPLFTIRDNWNAAGNFEIGNFWTKETFDHYLPSSSHIYDELLNFRSGFGILAGRVAGVSLQIRGMASPSNDIKYKESNADAHLIPPQVEFAKFAPPRVVPDEDEKTEAGQNNAVNTGTGTENIQIRKNFNETAFFQPDLLTDSSGNLEIKFTMPEALTKWKWMVLANTKELSMGYGEKMVVTQKELMVQTNMPRFFRQGDKMLIPVKIANLSEQTMTGNIHLEWLDPEEKNNQDKILANTQGIQPFAVNAGQSKVVFFSVTIPSDYNQPVLYRITAKSNSTVNQYSDGEQAIIPVLSNRMLVTETLPLNMNFKTEEHFEFEKLLKSKPGGSLQNQSLTVEYTTNPIWNAVQALPYMMEFPYECAEQTFNRFYANALAANILKVSPAIQMVFEKWQNTDTAELISNLQKNEELKSVLIRETPWVLDAQTETQQKKNIALLFNLVKMKNALRGAMDKLKQMQSSDGGFVWFKGGKNDRYITQYIITGIGHLEKLRAIPEDQQSALDKISRSAMQWLDGEITKDYDRDHKLPTRGQPDDIQIQYLYMRSFFPEIPLSQKTAVALNFYKGQSIQFWTKQSVYMQAMIALFLNRSGDVKNSKDILASLKENATVSEELGMYWRTVTSGYYWQQAPVETEAGLIETFNELGGSQTEIDQMKLWLLQQKRTSYWPTTKATADACYALLLSGSDWIANDQSVKIQLGDFSINSDSMKTDAGTGYFKERISGDKVKPEMGNIQMTINPKLSTEHAQPTWGAIYWQYFEDLDRITPAGSSLNISRGLFIERTSSQGPVLEAVNSNNTLKPGSKLVMRIIIKTDRDLEYVHLNDKRAACLEPVNVLSGYQWQDGLGYYQSTKDESTSFFFDRLPKGTHVFEYPVFVTTAGDYSNGISTLECMYAPEFAAHSEGVRIHVESN